MFFFPRDQTLKSPKQQRNTLRFWSTFETKSQTRRQELHFSASGYNPMGTPKGTSWQLIGTKLWGRCPGKETCTLKEIITPSTFSPRWTDFSERDSLGLVVGRPD